MASGYPGPVSAAQVGSYFVGQYYQVLQQQPDWAHQFYKDASTMIRIDGDSSQSASATLQIHELIRSLNFTGIEIKTINSLQSWSGGVLVVVSGSIRAKHISGRREFVQTFVLAPQEKGYFVLNDIFHFTSEDVVHQHQSPILSENKVDAQLSTSTLLPEPPVSDYGLEPEASEYVNSVDIDEGDPDEGYGFEEQQEHQAQQQGPATVSVWEETPAEESPTLLQNVVEAMPDPVHSVEEPVGEAPKLTYASILRAPKGQSVPSVTSRPSLPKSTQPASEWHPSQPAAQQLSVPESSLEAPEEIPSLEEEGDLKSVYVRNLPSTVSSADIEQEFNTFGRIIPDGVFIRNRKDIGVCYAFVEFEDLQAVQNAIKASPIQLAGRQVYIEERRANSSGASRGGRRGRGRGGYQSDNFRGRSGVGRSSGRGGNQEFRGNGFRG